MARPQILLLMGLACAAWAASQPTDGGEAPLSSSETQPYAEFAPAAGYDAAEPAAAPLGPRYGDPGFDAPSEESPQPDPIESRARPIPGGQIIARVGPEVILAADIMPRIEEMLERNAGQASPEELEQARQMLAARELQQFIETKILYLDARKQIPQENFPHLEEKLTLQFDQYFVPMMLKDAGAANRAELEEQLKRYGSSLSAQKRVFMERTLATQWLRQQIKFDREISHDEALAYYREHQSDYQFEARARWEEIMVRFDHFRGKAAAYRAIAELGNQVVQGAPFGEVAKAGSHGVTAEDGGQWDWTSRGSLVSRTLNQAIFTLPVGHLSQILETQQGFHIVRVLERHDAGRTPFEEAQVEIRKKIQKEDIERQKDEYLARVRNQTPIWTIFDDQPQQAANPARGGSSGPKY